MFSRFFSNFRRCFPKYPIIGMTGFVPMNKESTIKNNRVNICYTDEYGIKKIFNDGPSNKMLFEKDQIVVDYHKIKSIEYLDEFINDIKNKDKKCLIICNNKSALPVEEYSEDFFECLDKYKDKITIIYLCRSEKIYGNDYSYV